MGKRRWKVRSAVRIAALFGSLLLVSIAATLPRAHAQSEIAAPLRQDDPVTECRKACCIGAGGLLLTVGQPNPKDSIAFIGGGTAYYCGLTRGESELYLSCTEGCQDALGSPWVECLRGCCPTLGGQWISEDDWLVGESLPKFSPAGDSGFGCSTTQEGQEAWNECFDRCRPLEEGISTTPTAAACNVVMTAQSEYVQPGQTTEITVQVLGLYGHRLSGVEVDYYVSAGPGDVLGDTTSTDSAGKLRFTYIAPERVGLSTSATITAKAEGCDVMGSATVYFGSAPTPTNTPIPSPTIPPPPTTPTRTPQPPPPTRTPQAIPFDVWVDKIVPLQSIEGAALIANKPMGVRVFVKWDGFGDSPPLIVTLHLDGALVGFKTFIIRPVYDDAKKKNAEDSANFVIARDLLTPGQHLLGAMVQLTSGQPDADPSNDTLPLTTIHASTRPLHVMFNVVVPALTRQDATLFSARAKAYMEDVYPIPYLVRHVGAVAGGAVLDTSWGAAVAQCTFRSIWNGANPHKYVDFVVGLFPTGHYGEGNLGFSFAFCRRGVLVDIGEVPTTAHEIGHFFLGGNEEYEEDGTRGVRISDLSRFRSHALRFDFIRPSDDVVNIMGSVMEHKKIIPGSDEVDWINPQTSDSILALLTNLSTARHEDDGGKQACLVDEILPETADLRQNGPGYLLSGYVDLEDHVFLNSPVALAHAEVETQPGGDYVAEALDAEGRLLTSVSFFLHPLEYGEDQTIFPFVLTLPAPPTTSQIVFKHGAQTIHTLTRSASPPLVGALSQPGSAALEGTSIFSWEASDPDGDALNYDLYYSPDAGETWHPLAVGLSETHYALDWNELPGGEECILRLIASDGLNTTSAQTAPFPVTDKLPSVSIIGLREGGQYAAGEPVALSGFAFDLEDGEIPSSQLQWLNSQGLLMGVGAQIVMEDLPAGEQRIFLLANDSSGQFHHDEVTFTVLPGERGLLFIPPGATWLWIGLLAALLGWAALLGGIIAVLVLRKKRPKLRPLLFAMLPLILVMSGVLAVSGARAMQSLQLPQPKFIFYNAPEEEMEPPQPLGTQGAPAPPAAFPTGWQSEIVDPGKYVGAQSSLALGAHGSPHVSYNYYFDEDHDLRYASLVETVWRIESVDMQPVTGWFTSLALDVSGQPRISYYNAYMGSLMYAALDGAAWQISVVDSGGNLGRHTSLALDAGQRAHIAYFDLTNGDLKYAYQLETAADAWGIEVVDSEGEVGEYASLALDALGRPHISYYDRTNGSLRYSYFDGASWQRQTVDRAGDVGIETSLALDAAGRPHIAYFDATNGDLKYAYYDGHVWEIVTVDAEGQVGRSPSIALDAIGNAHISYYDLDAYALKYVAFDGSAWRFADVDLVGAIEGREGTSLVLDALSLPHISYYSVDGLKYASGLLEE
jgi:hypothetical protein